MGKLKRMVLVLLPVLLVIITVMNVYASGLTEQMFITVKINGQTIFTDTNPYIKQCRTFVPIRFIAEAFGMDVKWNQEERKAVLEDETRIMEVWLDSDRLKVNDEEHIMDVNVEGVNGRTMVPVRHFAETMGFTVEWDDYTYSVEINKEGADIPASSVFSRSYTDDDIIWLARIVHVEGFSLGVEGKVGIANVVLNRVKNPAFPGTIHDVIFDTRYSMQFPPAHKTGFKDFMPGGPCVIAAKMALEGINNVDESLYFNHIPFKNKAGDLFKVIEGEYFYY